MTANNVWRGAGGFPLKAAYFFHSTSLYPSCAWSQPPWTGCPMHKPRLQVPIHEYYSTAIFFYRYRLMKLFNSRSSGLLTAPIEPVLKHESAPQKLYTCGIGIAFIFFQDWEGSDGVSYYHAVHLHQALRGQGSVRVFYLNKAKWVAGHSRGQSHSVILSNKISGVEIFGVP